MRGRDTLASFYAENVCCLWMLLEDEIMHGLDSEAEKLCGYSRGISAYNSTISEVSYRCIYVMQIGCDETVIKPFISSTHLMKLFILSLFKGKLSNPFLEYILLDFLLY